MAAVAVVVLLLLAAIPAPSLALAPVLVVGGTGRVGGSAVRKLAEAGLRVDVGSRSTASFDDLARRLGPELQACVRHVPMDTGAPIAEVAAALRGYEVVVNTAGPFQYGTPTVLEACISNGNVAYVDVCDSIEVSREARKLAASARAANVSAVIAAGIWPGASSLLSSLLVERAGGPGNVANVEFSFHTGGTGGSGPTILSATFLILAEDALAFEGGSPAYYPSGSDAKLVDFGPALGRREVFRMNLIETESTGPNALGVSTVLARFGTAPIAWNRLLQATTLLPKPILRNRSLMQAFSIFSLPAVRFVDKFFGTQNGIRVDVTAKDGRCLSALAAHADMEDAVGVALSSFVTHAPSVAPGVWFPEEVPSRAYRQAVLEDVAATAITWRADGGDDAALRDA